MSLQDGDGSGWVNHSLGADVTKAEAKEGLTKCQAMVFDDLVDAMEKGEENLRCYWSHGSGKTFLLERLEKYLKERPL